MPLLGDFNRLGRARCHTRRLTAIGLLDIDSALEEGAVLDADARRSNIAVQSAFGANVHAIGGRDVAAHFAENDHFAGGDVSRHLAVAAYRDTVAGKVDAALDFAIDKQRLRTGDLALDEQSFPDGGLFGAHRSLGASRLGGGDWRNRPRRLRRWVGAYRSGLAWFPHSAQGNSFSVPGDWGMAKATAQGRTRTKHKFCGPFCATTGPALPVATNRMPFPARRKNATP